ncbi:MAG: SRPBCC family protein [Acidimicrobiales bacterium]
MASVRYDIRIARPADEVFAVVGDSSRITEWFDGIDAVELGDGTRTITLAVGISLGEKIVTNDAELRRFQYSITDGLPDAEHLGTIDVLEDGEGACRVVYGTDVSDNLAGIVGPATESGLKGLKALLEG